VITMLYRHANLLTVLLSEHMNEMLSVVADTTQLQPTMTTSWNHTMGTRYYSAKFEFNLQFGLTEIAAHISWKEGVSFDGLHEHGKTDCVFVYRIQGRGASSFQFSSEISFSYSDSIDRNEQHGGHKKSGRDRL
jgi:hypothetical protein